MKHFALIGRTLTHSLSKEYFDAQHFADADYTLCPMPSLDGLRRWVEEKGICGFNVTVPYKQAVIPFLDALSPEAEAIGAVNCVVVDDGRLIGHNTDAPAFLQTIQNSEFKIQNSLILGTGGAAHAVAYALGQLGIAHRFVSRTPERHPGAIGYNQLPTIHYPLPTLIVNATPVGMYPDVESTPLIVGSGQWAVGSGQLSVSRSLSGSSPKLGRDMPVACRAEHVGVAGDPSAARVEECVFPFPVLVYDLVYNPSPTRLLREAAALGAQTKDGLEMLHLQAELSWHLWHLK